MIKTLRNDGTKGNDTLSPMSSQLRSWSSGIPSEMAFWKNYIDTKGAQWPDDFLRRLDPDTPMDRVHVKLIKGMKKKKVDILDVGSGPMTILGKRVPNVAVNLKACDPLAEVYQKVLDAAKVVPPIKTEFAPVEDLLWVYPPASFDLVHVRNALDHSFEPLRGIMQMLTLCRPGGYVLLSHYTNEAETSEYEGLHQWNFDKINGHFCLWSKTEKIQVNKHTSPFSTEKTRLKKSAGSTKVWLHVEFKRNSVKMPKSSETDNADRASEMMKFLVASAGKLHAEI